MGKMPSAEEFIAALEAHRPPRDRGKYEKGERSGVPDQFMDVRMSTVFALAKKFMNMVPAEIEKLLTRPVHEIRAGAVSIMDWQARSKRTSDARRKELFDLYLRRHDRINNWDLVDRAAPHVIGGYLAEKSRAPLYRLARSKDPWERRTAIVSTWFFIRKGDIDDTFGIAEQLVADGHEYVQLAVGSWVREAGKRDPERLKRFLDKYAPLMPRPMLRYAIEKLSKPQREQYLRAAKT